MDRVFKAFADLIASAAAPEHWPFFMMTVTLAVIGQIMSKRVFTRDRAHRYWGKSPGAKALHLFWHIGRESMPIHPYAVCMCIILPLWPDPEEKGWSPQEAGSYWLFCATCSLFVWIVVKALAKERGIVLELPGDSFRPPEMLAGDSPALEIQGPRSTSLPPPKP